VEDWQRQNYDPPHGEPDPGLWQVHIAVEAHERDAVARAAPHVVPAERVEVHTETTDGAVGDVLLALRVHATTSEEAVSEAARFYRQIRVEAGLPDAPALVLGYLSPWWHQNRIPHLGKEALDLERQGRYDLAVVRTQTVCELAIVGTLARLIRDQHPHANPDHLLRRPVTLRDEQSKALLYMLTQRRVQDEPWWPRYVDHVKRRNAIVHEGLVVTREDAVASIQASLDLRAWLLDVEGAPVVDDEEFAETPDPALEPDL
jgi:HEPN domain-containing protein